ncbi:glycosyltransferase family A protein [Piscinibacter sakaiensis]|uniref:glycosyltransferase family 2 protein n=1 Tax=Piscinibacter sakaiensis TaxID=1547922 RepID=UPI003726EA59
MNAPLPRALVFMNGRNCARYVGAALESLAWQTHPGLHVLYVDDASDDGSEALAREALAQFFHGRHTLVRNPQPLGKAHNAHVHLRANRAHGEFVAVLDADDQLLSATIVAELAAEYAAGWDVVWTNYETDAGQPGHCGPLDPFLPPRQQGWKTSHFFSFRTELLDGIDAGYFQDETGRWLGAACDRALALPVLDQTRRYRHLPVRAYRYTVSNPASHHNRDPQSVNFSSREQQRCAEVVDAKPPLPCRRWLFGPQAAGDRWSRAWAAAAPWSAATRSVPWPSTQGSTAPAWPATCATRRPWRPSSRATPASSRTWRCCRRRSASSMR